MHFLEVKCAVLYPSRKQLLLILIASHFDRASEVQAANCEKRSVEELLAHFDYPIMQA